MKKMDYNTPEPKPEVVKGINKQMLDQNKQELLNFFNVSPKTKAALTVSAIGVLLFFFSIYTGVFQNRQLDTLYPKEQSQASQTVQPHTPLEGAGYSFKGAQQLMINEPYELIVEANSATESATIMAAQIRFDPTFFEVQKINGDGSIVKEWIDSTISNEQGMVSLFGSFPKGHIAKSGDLLAKIVFLPKMVGVTEISVDAKNSKMYRVGDKKEIQIQFDRMQVEIK